METASEEDMLDLRDEEVEEEHEHEPEAPVHPESVVKKAPKTPAPPKEPERQLSKKKQKEELEELETLLADFGVNNTNGEGASQEKTAEEPKKEMETENGEKKDGVPTESKSAKKKKDKTSKEAKETQDQPDSSEVAAEPNESSAGTEQGEEDASLIDVKERLKKVASAKKKKAGKDLDGAVKAIAKQAAAKNARLAAAKKKEKNHYNQQPDSESEVDMLDSGDEEVEEEHEHEPEAPVLLEPVVKKAPETPAPPKEPERQLSKKERKKELEELEALLARVNKTNGEGAPQEKTTEEPKKEGETDNGENNGVPTGCKSAKAKETQEQPNSSGVAVEPTESSAGTEQGEEDASSIDTNDRLKEMKPENVVAFIIRRNRIAYFMYVDRPVEVMREYMALFGRELSPLERDHLRTYFREQLQFFADVAAASVGLKRFPQIPQGLLAAEDQGRFDPHNFWALFRFAMADMDKILITCHWLSSAASVVKPAVAHQLKLWFDYLKSRRTKRDIEMGL